MNELMQAIGSYGFPIVMCLAMFWYIIKSQENHRLEIEKMTEALNNNTTALNRLEVKIGADIIEHSNKS